MNSQQTIDAQTTLNTFFAENSQLTDQQKRTIRKLFLAMLLAVRGEKLYMDFQNKLTANCGKEKPRLADDGTLNQIFSGTHDQQSAIEASWLEIATGNHWLEAALPEFIALAMKAAILKNKPGGDKKYNQTLAKIYLEIFKNFPQEIFAICEQQITQAVEEAKKHIHPDDDRRQSEIRMRFAAIKKAIPHQKEVYQAPEIGASEIYVPPRDGQKDPLPAGEPGHRPEHVTLGPPDRSRRGRSR